MGLKIKAKTFEKRGVGQSDWRDIADDVMGRLLMELREKKKLEYERFGF